ncbi:GntR family transcriptional regulator [Cellulophaga sp. 20_2_10]|uniref:winged helix-turn-helix domain-containing protein n=1 Tax=Cellulophaga sp. 20_2_10 TaxID=2942476 RepID=UPI00201A749F|nr:winged helix-turn-helix domain-containing protein [Cellulophaga sp. 20_2_10]MCL5245309.1 GntR family transcriptional regulator [Cellulophaga sp. 20_2_10]
MGIVSIKGNSGVPKYKQIIASVEEAIELGALKKGDKLPSINSIRDQHKLSRDTVLMAFNELKTRGIVQSIAGKGYYLISENVNVVQKVFLLFDELNSFKEDLYNSFLERLGANVQVDIYFHHFNPAIFSKLIYDNIGDYKYYVLMPANLQNIKHIVEKLPKDKVYILDQTNEELAEYPAIYQNFKKNVFEGLQECSLSIKKYKKMVLLFSQQKQPQGILEGFNVFCKNNAIAQELVSSIKECTPVKGELYFILDDRSLIILIKKIQQQQLVLGKDIGIICYNDSLLKEVVEGGITTISTNFNTMGERLAEMILSNENIQIENPNSLIVRNSL